MPWSRIALFLFCTSKDTQDRSTLAMGILPHVFKKRKKSLAAKSRLLALLLFPTLAVLHWHFGHSLTVQSIHDATEPPHSPPSRKGQKNSWNGQKKWLCSALTPNLTATAITFRMAQRIFFGRNVTLLASDTVINAFFSHWPGHYKFQDAHTNTTTLVLRTYKCGSMTLKAYLKDTLSSHISNSTFGTAFPFDFFPTQHGCILTAYRDPISHFISGVGEVEYRHENVSTAGTYEALPKLSEDRFLGFMEFLLQGKWYNNPAFYQGNKSWRNIFSHVLPQSGYLVHLSFTNQSISSYIHLDDIEREFRDALIHDCGLPFNIPPVQHTKSHGKVAGLDEFLRKMWVHTDNVRLTRALEAVCLLHAMDYACLSAVLREPPPAICSRAYEKYLPHY